MFPETNTRVADKLKFSDKFKHSSSWTCINKGGRLAQLAEWPLVRLLRSSSFSYSLGLGAVVKSDYSPHYIMLVTKLKQQKTQASGYGSNWNCLCIGG